MPHQATGTRIIFPENSRSLSFPLFGEKPNFVNSDNM